MSQKEYKIQVIHSNGDKEDFKPRVIGKTILKETNIDADLAKRIQNRVTTQIHKLGLDEISTSMIRSQVSSQLLKEGEIRDAENSMKLGMSVAEFENLINNGCKDNANISYSPEMIAKYAYDSIAKEYALLTMPQDCAQAHKDGLIHIHDLEYYNTRPNCLSGDNKIIIKNENDIISYVRIDDFVNNYDYTKYKVPTVNLKNNNVEWKPIDNSYKSGFEDVYRITFNKGLSIETTYDHKFIKSHNNKPCDNYKIKVSEFNNYKDLRLLNNTNLYQFNKDNDYYKSALFGIFLSDGYINKYGQIRFTFTKKSKIDYLDRLLQKLNIEYNHTIYENGNHYFGIKDKIYGDKKISKSELISKFIHKINYKGLLEGFINSDCTLTLTNTNKIRLNFTNTNKDIFDLYQLALLCFGIRGSYSIHIPKNDNHNISYNSSSFGSNLIKLLKSIWLKDDYYQLFLKHDNNVKEYKDIGELTVKSVEYVGKKYVYNLTVRDNHNYMAGINGFVLTQNCLNYDLRFFARNGLKIDGVGLMGSVAKPAKSLEVLLNHMLQAWMAGATTMSGGQGYGNFNTLLAPFCRGRSYDDIKQAIQGFIFNCNMSLICRGGQVLFSSIALDLSTPDVLANEPAIGPGGVAMGVYRDYREEADLIFKAVCEVLNEKDGAGAYHRFPNVLFNIREGDLDKFEGNCKLLHELGANNPTIYYNNCVELERSTMGCRSSLPMNYSGDYAKDCLNTGNFMYNTINLHLLALESKNIDEFYTLLDNVCELCYKSLLHRREVVIDAVYNKHMSDFLIQKDKETGEPLWDIDRTTITLGYCGLNECLETLYGKNESTSNDQDKHGVDIINFINHKKEEFYKRDGLRWSVIASPAESTASRFAEINKTKYPDCHVQGKKGGYYLTNSHHIPVSSEVDLITHVKNAGDYHPISLGGAILHLFMGEIWTDPRSLWKFNQKIIDSGAIFWAYSKVFTYCAECGFTINDDIDVCPICGSTHLRKHERITGYYLCVATFNPGKTQEVNDRHRHEFD